MKKLIFGLLAIAVVFAISCKKDINQDEPKSQLSSATSVVLEPVVIDQEQSKITKAKIKAFKDRMKSDTKEVIYYDEEEAQWLIDACANYDFTSINDAFPEYYIDTFMYLIPSSPEGISSEDLESVYEQITEDMESIMTTLQLGEDYELQGIIVKFTDNANIQQMVSAELMVTLGFHPNVSSFSTTNNDYWYWGLGLGRQNGYDVGLDASTQITYAANQAIITMLNPGNYNFTHSISAEINNFDVPFQNYYGSRLWNMEQYGQMGSFVEPVLTPAEMNEFTNHALYIAQQFIPQPTINGEHYMIQHVIVEALAPQYVGPSTYNNYYRYLMHKATILYGIPN